MSRLIAKTIIVLGALSRLTASPLTDAIRLNDDTSIQANLNTGSIQADGESYGPLAHAIIAGKTDLVRILLKKGADPNHIAGNGKTPLYLAAQWRRLEILHLLHGAKASLPAQGQGLNPAEAAVISSSLEIFDKMLELYPEADFDRKWTYDNGLRHYQPRSSISNACYHHNYELAERLLKKTKCPQVEKNHEPAALFHLCADHQAPLALIEKVLAAGHSPLNGRNENNLVPTTPLRVAAYMGSLEKLTVLIRSLDGKRHKQPLLVAASIAHYRGHAGCANLLLEMTSATLEDALTYVKQKRWGDDARSSTCELDYFRNKRKNSGLGATIDLLPRTQPTLPKGTKQGSLAIIGPDELGDVSALLLAGLSSKPGLMIVERQELNTVASENALKNFQARDAKNLQSNLDLVGAENILILSKVSDTKTPSFFHTLINTSTGITLFSGGSETQSLESEKGLDQLCEKIASRLFLNSGKAEGLVAFTQIPLVAERLTAESARVSASINHELLGQIGRNQQHIILSRDQFHQLEFENTIKGKQNYWKTGWVIDGSFTLNGEKEVTVRVRASSAKNNKHFEVTTTGSSEKLSPLLDKAWQKISSKISIKNAAPEDDVSVSNNEIAQLRKQRRWFFASGLTGEALRVGKAVAAMTDQSVGSLFQVARIYEQHLPLTSSRGKEATPYQAVTLGANLQRSPESLHPEAKYLLTEYLDDYLDYGTTLINLTTLENKNKDNDYTIIKVAGKGIDSLIYYRMAIEGLQHEGKFDQKIRTYDKVLKLLLNEIYQKRLTHEPNHLGLYHLDEFGYIARYQREFLSKIIFPFLLSGKQISNRAFIFNDSAFDILAAQLKDDQAHRRDLGLWHKLLKQQINSTKPIPAMFPLLFSLAEGPEDRIEMLHRYTHHLKPLLSTMRWINQSAEFSKFYNALAGAGGSEFISLYPFTSELGFRLPLKQSLRDLWIPGSTLDKNSHDYRRLFHAQLAITSLKQSDLKYFRKIAHRLITDLIDERRKPLYSGDFEVIEHFAKQHLSRDPETLMKIREYAAKSMRRYTKNHLKLKPKSSEPGEPQAPRHLELPAPLHLALPSEQANHSHFLDISTGIVSGDHFYTTGHRFKPSDGLDKFRERDVRFVVRYNLVSGETKYQDLPVKGNGLRYLIDGENFIYGIKTHPGRLVVIKKDTLETRLIPLPFRYIGNYSENTIGDKFYLCTSESRKHSLTNSNILLELDGFSKPIRLTSSLRKPAVSPADNPALIPSTLFTHEGALWISMKSMVNRVPGTLYRYTPDLRSWALVKPPEWKKAFKKKIPSLNERLLATRTIPLEGELVEITAGSPFMERKYTRKDKTLAEASLNVRIHHKFHGKDQFTGRIKITLSSKAGHVWKKKGYFNDRSKFGLVNHRYHYITNREALDQRLLQYRCEGLWNDHYVICISNNVNALPCIWLAPKSQVDDLARKMVEKR